MPPLESTLEERLAEAGQAHVLRFLSDLEADARARLLAQLEALDLDLVTELAALQRASAAPEGPRSLEPPALFPLERDAAQESRAHDAVACGTDLLQRGEVGYVLVAGGQASRLGYDGPKGAFELGPVSGRPLFGWHAHRLRAAAERHGCPTPWYVMTSPANDAVTRNFFRGHDFFGLPEEDVFFFQQEMLPALDQEGRILMAARDSVFLAPNGHGGVLWGLAQSGALEDAKKRGVTRLSYFQVDNPLARPADPLFLGLHALEEAGMSSKVVKKRDAGEKVGVLGWIDGKMGCIEYSDLPEELREQRDADGELSFRAGNIAVHVLDVDFVASLTAGKLELPWHLATKQMKVMGPDGEPTEVTGTKFETFVFDALSRSKASVTLEVDRALEFSPVKNAEGSDSPRTCREDLCRLFAGWVAPEARPAPDASGIPRVEVDPLLAETAEEFQARGDAVAERLEVLDGGHLYR